MPRYLVHTVFLLFSFFLLSFQELRAVDGQDESDGLSLDSGINALRRAAEAVQFLKTHEKTDTTTPEGAADIKIFDDSWKLGLLLWIPYGSTFKEKLTEIFKRLALPGEKKFYYSRTATLAPWSNLLSSRVWRKIVVENKDKYTTDALEIGLGLLSLIASEDELAAIVSAQISAESPDLSFFNWKKEIPWVQEFTHWIDTELPKIMDSDHLDPQFRNTIISDIQAIERLIQSGYNPNALIELHNKVSHWVETTKKIGTQHKLMKFIFGKAYIDLSNRPNQELRIGAMKKYLFFRIRNSKIQHLLTQHTELNKDLKKLSHRAKVLSTLFASKWTRYILATATALGMAYLGFSLLDNPYQVLIRLSMYLENGLKYLASYLDKKGFYTTIAIIFASITSYAAISDWIAFKSFAISILKALRNFLLLPFKVTIYTLKLFYRFLTFVGSLLLQIPGLVQSASSHSFYFFKNDFADWTQSKWGKIKSISKDLMKAVRKQARISMSRTKTEIEGFFSMLLDLARLAKSITEKQLQGKQSPSYSSDQSRNKIEALIARITELHYILRGSSSERSFVRRKFGKSIDVAKLQNSYRELKIITQRSDPLVHKIVIGYISGLISRDIAMLLRHPEIASSLIDFLQSCDPEYFHELNSRPFSASPLLETFRLGPLTHYDDLFKLRDILISTHNLLSGNKADELWISNNFFQRSKPLAFVLSQILKFKSLSPQSQFLFLYLITRWINDNKGDSDRSPWIHLIKTLFDEQKNHLANMVFRDPKVDSDMIDLDIKKLDSEIKRLRAPKKDQIGISSYEEISIIDIMKKQLSLVYSRLSYDQFLHLSAQIELLHKIEQKESISQNPYGYINSPKSSLYRFHDSIRLQTATNGSFQDLAEYYPKSEQFDLDFRGLLAQTEIDLNALLIKYSKQSLSDFERMGWYAAYRQSSPKSIKNQREYWDAEQKWFIHFLVSHIHSVSELRSWISDQLVSHQIPTDGLVADFYQLVFDHPEWIKSKEDIEALTQSKFFWPKKNSLGKQATPMEEAILESIEKHSSRFSEYWQVEPAAAEALHQRIIDFAQSKKIYGDTFDEQFEFWKTLSARGVTSTTDALFEKLWERANEDQKSALSTEALKGRIWDLPLKVSLVRLRVIQSEEYKKLISNTMIQNKGDPSVYYLLRRNYILSLIDMIQTALPERGIGYFSILEDLANQIHANREETEMIEKAKYGSNLPTKKTQDYAVRTLSNLLEHVLSWKLSEQFDFILFLRGDIEPSAFIREQFNVVGPERVRRMFQILPLEGRAGVLESFLSSPRGLLSSVNLEQGYAKIFIDHLLKDGSEASQEVGKQVLEAFLYAMEKTGHQNYRSYVFSYLLGMLKNNQESSTGAVLKRVLETFGATGVKIGQFLAISGILPEAENKYLEELQDKAKIPERHHLYQELDEITGLNPFPFDIEDILGSASLKYALRATDQKSNESFVLKVLRKESEVHVETEFAQLHHMADYLVSRNGARYGIFRAIIKASQKAVERELELTHEAEMSKVARRRIYNAKPHPKVRVAVPLEFTMAPRLMASQFAPGSSFRELAPEWKPLAAEAILRLEVPNLFQDSGTTQLATSTDFAFDPDRHAGNYRIQVLKNNPDGDLLSLVPIDFGQVLLMKAEERNQFFDLFALSGILNKTGSTVWAAQKIQTILKIQSPDFVTKIQKQLPQYFSSAKAIENPLSAYYALLAALEDAGSGLDIQFFDFPRAIAQLSRYTKHVPDLDPKLNPEARLREEALKRADIFKADMEAHIAQTDGLKGKIIQEHLAGKVSRSSKIIQSLGSCAQWIKKFKKG